MQQDNNLSNRKKERKKRLIAKFKYGFTTLMLPVTGMFALLWFLIRVVPKPSRAMYPCQRVAFPIASTFIIWMTGIFSSIFMFKKVKYFWNNRRTKYTIITSVILLFAVGFTLFNTPTIPVLADDEPFVPTDKPNQPVGTARGIMPGRVVWAHNTDATSWNGGGNWSSDKYTDQSVVDDMMAQSVKDLAAVKDEKTAWDAIFRYYNKTNGKGDVGYQPGEKISVKLNLNACGSHDKVGNRFYTSPHVTFALLKQLVNDAGVPAQNITFYDATRSVPDEIFKKCKNVYPNVNFNDFDGGDGRLKIQRDLGARIKFSQKLTLEPGGGNPTYVPQCVSRSDYHINLGQLKGHNLAGITLGAKNMFGSIVSYPANDKPQNSSPKNAGLHPYICVHSDFHFNGHWDFDKRDMATYNVLVDLMGHQELGAKTILYIIDGLYSAPDQSTALKKGHKWRSFNNDWPNSLFLSQDPVAIESVCLDFMRNESGQTWVRGNVDNYLHEAALAHDPPSGIKYDPEQDGTVLSSLGVHEHWNNDAEKMYTRNLGTGNGIELVKAGDTTTVAGGVDHTPSSFQMVQNYPNPFKPSTTVLFQIKNEGRYDLKVYDLTGRQVVVLFSGVKPTGRHKIVWNGNDLHGNRLPSGVYFIGLTGENTRVFHRTTLLR